MEAFTEIEQNSIVVGTPVKPDSIFHVINENQS